MRSSGTVLMFVVTGATLFAGDSPASQPKTCPFGHTTLSWRKVESADIPQPGKELFCTTCGFAYEEQLSRWERAVSFSELTTGILPDFPDVIQDFPVPKEKKELKSVRYRQIRTNAGVVCDSCFYWTGASFKETKDRLRDYLGSAGFSTKEVSRPYGPRMYFYFFARSGERFLRVEVMLESNEQVAVDARLVASSEIEHDYVLRKALGINTLTRQQNQRPRAAVSHLERYSGQASTVLRRTACIPP